MYLPNELWNIVKEYQLDWKKTHKKSFVKVTYELKYIFDYYCCSPTARECPRFTVHKITGYFQNCYFNHR